MFLELEQPKLEGLRLFSCILFFFFNPCPQAFLFSDKLPVDSNFLYVDILSSRLWYLKFLKNKFLKP